MHGDMREMSDGSRGDCCGFCRGGGLFGRCGDNGARKAQPRPIKRATETAGIGAVAVCARQGVHHVQKVRDRAPTGRVLRNT